MDSIFLRGIECNTRIGVPESERARAQKILVDVELFLSTKKIAASDDIHDGIDYAKVTERVIALSRDERKTVERFAEDIAAAILADFKPTSVKVTVWKTPDLPLQSASVTISRP